MATESGINLTGKVNIIAGFPCIGKTTTTNNLANDPLYEVVDANYAIFTKNLAESERDNAVEHYVDYIEVFANKYRVWKVMRETANATYLILIDDTPEVLAELNARNIQYYHIIPQPDAAGPIIEKINAIIPTEDNMVEYFETERLEQIVHFGSKYVEDQIAENGRRPSEMLIQLPEDYYLLDLIQDSVEFSMDTILENVMTSKSQRKLGKLLAARYEDASNKDFCKIFLDQTGAPVFVGESIGWKTLAKIMNKAGIPGDNVQNCASFGANRCLVKESKLKNLVAIAQIAVNGDDVINPDSPTVKETMEYFTKILIHEITPLVEAANDEETAEEYDKLTGYKFI